MTQKMLEAVPVFIAVLSTAKEFTLSLELLLRSREAGERRFCF